MATLQPHRKEDGPGQTDPQHKNEKPEIGADEDLSVDNGKSSDVPEVSYAPRKPEFSAPLEPAK